MKPFLLPFLLFALFGGALAAFDPSSYPNSTQLTPDYEVFWRIDLSKKHIYLGLKVKTTGWIGFGISEKTSGSMPGADMAIVSFIDGKPTISDRYAVAFATPLEDGCQDWILVSAEQADGVSSVELKRKLDTTDTQDRKIEEGKTKVVYAYGLSDQPSLSYHADRRGINEIEFIPSESNTERVPEANEKTATFTMSDFTVPAQETVYACRAFDIPLSPDSEDHHIVQIDPVIDPRGAHLTHHMLIHICQNVSDYSYANRYYNKSDTCFTPIGDINGGCMSLLYSWALGVGPLVVPKEAGFRMGFKRPAFRYMLIEMHYNNPNRLNNVVDSSGFKIHYTPTLRQYDAATITLGDPLVTFGAIPPGIERNKYEASCPSQCTQKFSHEIKVFGSFLHMHNLGAQMWTTHYRDEKLIGTINRAEFYSYNNQQSTPVNVTIKPGDRINVHCIYDSRKQQNATRFGVESTDEMCMDFVTYYPRLDFQDEDFSLCGILNTTTFGNITVCGSTTSLGNGASYLFVGNPVNPDMAQGEARIFGQSSDHCKKLSPVALGLGIGLGALLILSVIIGGIIYTRKTSSYQQIPEKVGLES